LAAFTVLAALFVSIAGCGPAPTATTPSPTAEALAPIGRPAVLGCTDILAGQCAVVTARIIATLPPERGAPFSVEVRLGPCPNDANCPKTLGVRTGNVMIEYLDGGEPIQLSLAGTPEAPIAAPMDASWSGLIQPSSKRVDGPGPFVFDVGHCGLTHVVDFDGSYWIPVGEIDGAGNALINSEQGTIRLAGANVAEYRGTLGFSMRLARWPGAKRFFLCD
jgi:hypothetical protein